MNESQPSQLVKSKPRRPRVTRTPEQWAELLYKFESSGLTQQAFCKQYRISTGSLYKWREKLGNHPPHVPAEPAPFVEIGQDLINDQAADSESNWQVELELGKGVILRLRSF